MREQLLGFVEKFFDNLGAKEVFQNNILTITNVPDNFQKYYGRNEPYRFSIIKTGWEDVEILEKGSYTMKAIRGFLDDSGQTTLLKIDFDMDPVSEIKKRFKLENSRLIKLVPKKRHKIFFRFTFHTSFQYLNQRDKVINDIYIHENKVINGNLESYPVVEGKKSDIRIPDMKEPYFTAKEYLKTKLEKKTKIIVDNLNHKLEKETLRINNHFQNEGEEIMSNIKRAVKKLNELVLENDETKIQRQSKILHNLKEKMHPKERIKDKERAIQIEKNKHSLNVNNKLFNTTLIYHPLFTYDAYLKNEDTQKTIEIVFDPLTKTLAPIKCSSCGKETNSLYLCKNGHVVCKDCFTPCESCGKGYCKDCITTTCELCNRSICDDCKIKCYGCGKTMCKTHTHLDKATGRVYCNNCLTRCERCSSLKVGENFRVSKKTGVKICEDCYRKEMQESALEGVFED